MRKLKIMAVCGFGLGTSMILKMNIDEVLKKQGLEADVFTSDIGSAPTEYCDIIFTSNELYGQLEGKVNVPVIKITNFMSRDEIQEKGLKIIKELL